METYELYQVAKDRNIPIILLAIPENGSMCIQSDAGRCYIGMDCDVVDGEADRRVHLAHELGHCVTGSFYNRWAARDLRKKHEHRADKWAIKHLVPKEYYDQEIAAGRTEIWELAEQFNVSEDFVKKAVCFYTYGNLNPELYF